MPLMPSCTTPDKFVQTYNSYECLILVELKPSPILMALIIRSEQSCWGYDLFSLRQEAEKLKA